tara:strand:- start:118 stop:630 length:513 start_codon:yes stop_codon:yes gene_type:complete
MITIRGKDQNLLIRIFSERGDSNLILMKEIPQEQEKFCSLLEKMAGPENMEVFDLHGCGYNVASKKTRFDLGLSESINLTAYELSLILIGLGFQNNTQKQILINSCYLDPRYLKNLCNHLRRPIVGPEFRPSHNYSEIKGTDTGFEKGNGKSIGVTTYWPPMCGPDYDGL